MTTPGTISRPSRIAGQGLFATRDFAPGEMIAAYTGSLLTAPPATKPHQPAAVFILELAPGLWLDGADLANPARHANHSCEPNADLVWHRPATAAWLIARQAIPLGIEITFDYGFSLAESLFHPCHCGAPSCPGRIVATPLRISLRRHLRFSRPRD